MAHNPSDHDLIQFCTDDGHLTGETGPKVASHTATTQRHLAFSVFVFNTRGQVLVSQRSHHKTVWPLVWTGTCCGHPLPGESMEAAMARRLDYELRLAAQDFTIILPTYRYTTPSYHGIVENEFCPVYFARTTAEPNPNPLEVENYQWLDWAELIRQAAADGHDYRHPDAPDAPRWSYWMKDQLKHLPHPEQAGFTGSSRV